MGEINFNKMWRFFSALCPPLQPPQTEREIHKSYLTFESMEQFLPKYFGHKCDFLVQGIFQLLSNDVKLSRVYFKTFLERFYFALWSENPREREKFIFKLIDNDKDGIITGKDLIRCSELIDLDSKFGQEI